MQKLLKKENSYFINSKKEFKKQREFKKETVKKVFDFAYEMTFGNGEHRDHRTGGSIKRKKAQIFINTFQGKLSELAVYNAFAIYNKKAYQKLSKPDFEVYGLGEWDDSDITYKNVKFSIKSTKFYGNLLLLETKDWNSNAEYIPNLKSDKNYIYDYFILVRIKPDAEQIMKKNKMLYLDYIKKEQLYSIIKSEHWQYDIAGYITQQDLKTIINENFILPKNALLNGTIQMDAQNYYIQSGDLKDIKTLIEAL